MHQHSFLPLPTKADFLWGSPFLFVLYFFCVPSYMSGVHHSSSSSAFPAISEVSTILLLLRSPSISAGFTILLFLRPQLYLYGSPFWGPPRWPSGKASASRAEDPGFESRLRLNFVSRSSHTSDLKIGAPVATLPDAWRYRIGTGTGRPGVYCDWVR